MDATVRLELLIRVLRRSGNTPTEVKMEKYISISDEIREA